MAFSTQQRTPWAHPIFQGFIFGIFHETEVWPKNQRHLVQNKMQNTGHFLFFILSRYLKRQLRDPQNYFIFQRKRTKLSQIQINIRNFIMLKIVGTFKASKKQMRTEIFTSLCVMIVCISPYHFQLGCFDYILHAIFYENNLISSSRLKITKNQDNSKNNASLRITLIFIKKNS